MTPKEFKAWFEGFTEAMDGMPSEAQWNKVKERVAQIDGNPTSYPVYVDRYWPRPRPYWESPYWVTLSAGGAGVSSTSRVREMLSSNSPSQPRQMFNAAPACSPGDADFQEPPFDSHAAMYAAGKADFGELSAA